MSVQFSFVTPRIPKAVSSASIPGELKLHVDPPAECIERNGIHGLGKVLREGVWGAKGCKPKAE